MSWDEIKRELLKYPNVVGVSQKLAPKIVKGKETEVQAVRVYVKRKLPLSALRPEDVIPREIEGVPTDVVEAEFFAYQPRTAKLRPFGLGVSVAQRNVSAGTSGLFVKWRGKLCVLSNAHVLHPNPFHVLGPKAKEVTQPGPYDFPEPFNMKYLREMEVGEYAGHVKLLDESEHVHLWHYVVNLLFALLRVPARYPLKEYNTVDAAVAYLDDEALAVNKAYSCRVSPDTHRWVGLLFAGNWQGTMYVGCKARNVVKELGVEPVGFEVADIKVGDEVAKEGRTTGYTEGVCFDDAAALRVAYGGLRVAWFEDVFVVRSGKRIAAPGDSGAGVFVRR